MDSEATAPPPKVVLGAYRHGRCDACGRAFSDGVGIVGGEDGNILASLCIWCLFITLDTVTGFDHTAQVVNWYTKKRWYRKIKELGWTGKAR